MITLSQLYYVYAAVSLLTIVFGCSIAINCRQVLSAPLLLLSRHRYRTEMRKCQGLFGSLILYVTFFYAPLDIILTGDHDGLTSEKSVVIMANHQVSLVVNSTCWILNFHGRVHRLHNDRHLAQTTHSIYRFNHPMDV